MLASCLRVGPVCVVIWLKCVCYVPSNKVGCCVSDKKLPGKSKDEQMAEKKQELEKRLQDVTGQLGSAKKPPKKGKHLTPYLCSVPYARFGGCLQEVGKYVHRLL